MSTQIIAFGLGPQELVVIAVLGLLIFGKRLPEVGKSLGKSIVEFKKGLHGVEDEINASSASTTRPQDILPPPRPAETVQRTDVNQTTPTDHSS